MSRNGATRTRNYLQVVKGPGNPHDSDGALVPLASDERLYIIGLEISIEGVISTGNTRATLAATSETQGNRRALLLDEFPLSWAGKRREYGRSRK